ncbi:MAG TPA: DUF6306 domain-containing protein, partial [Methylomirabilota bacterium]|nr:DUF6306 domain-containing protein [Methylomirabilota bacterium]
MERSRAGVLAKHRGARAHDIVTRLNELLEAEQAAAEAASRPVSMAAPPAVARFFEKVRDDTAWSCEGLRRVIRHLGRKVSAGQGGVATMGEIPRSLKERLAGLSRDQAAVVRRLERLLEADLDRETESFL